MVSDDVRRIREEGGTGKRGVTPRNEGLRLVIAVEHRDVRRLAGVAFLDYRWPRRRSPYIAKTTCLQATCYNATMNTIWYQTWCLS
jgi:hypothetical protein